MDAFYVGLILTFIVPILLIVCAVLFFYFGNGFILFLGGFISFLLIIAGAALAIESNIDPESIFFQQLILCALAIAESVWGIRILISDQEEANKKKEDENKEKERLRCRLKDDISELTNEQEKILNKWKRSAYCTRPNGKAEPKNETETYDEDADKKTD